MTSRSKACFSTAPGRSQPWLMPAGRAYLAGGPAPCSTFLGLYSDAREARSLWPTCHASHDVPMSLSKTLPTGGAGSNPDPICAPAIFVTNSEVSIPSSYAADSKLSIAQGSDLRGARNHDWRTVVGHSSRFIITSPTLVKSPGFSSAPDRSSLPIAPSIRLRASIAGMG